tara:strand:+ start:361 stop:474 length:114 start_codon:yes stop_codon:yes gene_type:complete
MLEVEVDLVEVVKVVVVVDLLHLAQPQPHQEMVKVAK